jgi:spore germination protein (amino acid permease)
MIREGRGVTRMTPSDDKISSIQVGVFVYNAILGVGILTLPSSLVKEVDQDAWILAIISGLINILFIYFMCKVGVKYSEYGFVGTLKKLFGSFFGFMLALPVFIYFLVFSGLETRIFAETLKAFLLSNTPLEFIILPLLILAIFLARSGVEPTSRFFEAVTPVIIFITVIIMLVPLPNSDFTNVRPLFASPISKYITGLSTGAFAFAGFEILLILFPFMRKPTDAFKVSLISLMSIIALYTIVTIECLAKFGSKETQSLIYPTMMLIKSSEIPGAFIERLEGLLIALWVLLVFTTIVALVFAFSIVGGDLLGHRKRKHIISVFLPAMYIVALQGQNIAQLFDLINKLTLYLGTYTVMVLPALMFIMSLFRGKGGKKSEG